MAATVVPHDPAPSTVTFTGRLLLRGRTVASRATGRSAAMGVNQRAQVVMTPEEIDGFLRAGRNMTVASLGPDGHPHLVAMWYGFVDGSICFETKSKSQKAVNLRRDPRVSCLIEDGEA